MTNILAIDPGKTSGIASKIGSKYFTCELHSKQEVYDFVDTQPWDQVVCENFTAEHISEPGLYTVELIGGIEALCMRRGIKFKRQQNILRMAFLAKAKELAGKLPRDHQHDALAHLLRWENDNA